MTYSHNHIEQKWQKRWIKDQIFHPNLLDCQKKKLYLLDMFPYPSGKGLHVGHLRGYLATDILTRMKMMQGYNVFHPIGFDSFGLPAERYAARTGNDPYLFTEKNIQVFINQLKSFGFGYDYQRIIKTHDPLYYKWTQWTFTKLYQHHLAKKEAQRVYYSQKLKTVLSKEEILDLQEDNNDDQYQIKVIKKKQWVIKISNYAQQLLQGLTTLQNQWPQRILEMQRLWIGEIKGYNVKIFGISEYSNKNFTKILFVPNLKILPHWTHLSLNITNELFDDFLEPTFLDFLIKKRNFFYLHPLLRNHKNNDFFPPLKSNLKIINPYNQKKITLFYCFQELETQFFHQSKKRDFLLQLKINHTEKLLQEYQLIDQKISSLDQTTIIKVLKQQNVVFDQFNKYKLRDWIFARQRYWGEPFPVQNQNNEIKVLPLKELPLKLPLISKELFLKTDSKTPLQRIFSWTEKGYDEDVMPQWAGSCWYFLAYLLRKDDGTFWPLNSSFGKKILNKWMPVDIYVGGAEHAVLHLLYARFWNYFLCDIKCYDVREPFKKLINQGLILDHKGKKMSKSKGNVVNPNDFLETHGADAMRLHINFSGTFENDVSWEEKNLDAMRKWLARVYRLFIHYQDRFVKTSTKSLHFIQAQTIKNVTTAIENFAFNSAISSLMTFINVCYKETKINIEIGKNFLKLLYPFAPHLCEEIWSLTKNNDLLIFQNWPQVNEQDLQKTKITLQIQVNGKFKFSLFLDKDLTKEEVILILNDQKKVFINNLKSKFFKSSNNQFKNNDDYFWDKYLKNSLHIIFKKNWFINFLII